MNVHSGEIKLKSKENDFIDLTEKVQEIVADSGIREGLCNVFVQHTTCFIMVNENEPNLKKDFFEMIYQLIPQNGHYNHDDGNAHAHLKEIMFSCDKTIPISNGKLNLGAWQSILFIDPDAPRDRKILVKVIGG
jgi:secondary thiamine-phosphate synthase enzyme